VQVEVLEQHRWASSFENELRDALRRHRRRLGALDVTKGGRQTSQPVWRVAVQLRQFDAVDGGRVDAELQLDAAALRRSAHRGVPAELGEAVGGGMDAVAQGAQRVTAAAAAAMARSVSAARANPPPRHARSDSSLFFSLPLGEGRGGGTTSKPWVLAAAIVGSSMAFIDGTVVNVALPALQPTFDAGLPGAVGGRVLCLAADRPAAARRRAWATATAGAASSPSAWAALRLASVAVRARGQRAAAHRRARLQGVGGALLVPGSLALISASFPERIRGKAIGTWSGFSGITAAIGPVLGGFLVDHFSWTWAF
jgi:hypothetical protein